MRALDLEFREHLADYLKGKLGLSALRNWLLHQGWNIDKRAGAVTAELVHEAELLLAEFDHADWTEVELKRHIRELFVYPVVALPGVSLHADSCAQTVPAAITVSNWGLVESPRLEIFDIQFEEASA